MQIRTNQGIVTSLMIQPFSGTEDDFKKRELLFEKACRQSGCTPNQRMDIFDETLLTFDHLHQALDFTLGVISQVLHDVSCRLSVRSGLCWGEYFLHGEQIYGAATNLATQLSFQSRENEILSGGIEQERIESYAKKSGTIEYFTRDNEKSMISICLCDEDSTLSLAGKSYLHIKASSCRKILSPQRNIRITIGRLESSDITIDSDHISRQHATLILKEDELFLEDHSSNGTYVYLDDKEVFLNRNSLSLGKQGIISCGARRADYPSHTIFFEFRDNSEATGEIRPISST